MRTLNRGRTVVPGTPDGPADAPTPIRQRRGPSDLVFRGVASGGGLVVLVVMLLVGGFLLVQAQRALDVAGWSFLTEQAWEPDVGAGHFGIAAVLTGTVLIALVAIAFAVPLATGTALYISEYAPRRIRQTLISLVDLMAAVPSVVYGLWGAFLLTGNVVGLARWISTYFGWIPIFAVDGVDPRDPLAPQSVYTASTFIAGMVVAMMVTPVACSIMREVFSQAPAGEREGAFALGATKWGMIRSVVLPFGRGGMIGGTMLGLGRALGETIAVVMIISPVFQIQPHLLQVGGNSVSALIALRYGDATEMGISALFAAGLALFTMTLIVNFFASIIIARSRSGAASEV
ncbi:phosphate ABC transporter permease subunit PstC [Micromonospora sp. NPDC050397]|uniref:phosphate ABC transporter permease subunit PstC n=1 Tax=Micromonospora sp. NPDC050397 TaxID=3364279 RepID=UPI00384B0604